jgi:signal transduction histidine kinase
VKFSHMKIKTRMLTTLGVIYLIASLVLVVLVNKIMKKQALVASQSEALMLLNHKLAIHTYFAHQLKPKVFSLTDGTRPAGFFDPTWMSSTYAIREINKYAKTLSPKDYYYKECAVNARSPENEADTYEKLWLERFNQDPKLVDHSEVRFLGGNPYFVTVRRGEQLETSCMRCHSTPSRAPGDLVASYGSQRSFNRREGETVSAISIRVPLSEAHGAANRFSLYLSGFLVGILGILFVIKLNLDRHYIYGPIAKIQNLASLIANSSAHLGETIPIPGGPELRDLASAFNDMSTRLRQIHDTLEQRIEERTTTLKHLNETLEKDNAALERAKEEIRGQSEQLRNLTNQLAKIQELERQNLARELHDQVCQNLIALTITLETMRLKAPIESLDHLLSEISLATDLVDKTIGAANEIMEGLRPSALIDYDYLAGLRQWAGQFSRRTGIVVDIKRGKEGSRLKAPVGLALFRIAQEALTNVAEHAQAKQVTVTEEVYNNTICLTIVDDGIGFDQTQMDQPEGYRFWGLMNMSERAAAAGGFCRIESQPGQGTRVVVEVSR